MFVVGEWEKEPTCSHSMSNAYACGGEVENLLMFSGIHAEPNA